MGVVEVVVRVAAAGGGLVDRGVVLLRPEAPRERAQAAGAVGLPGIARHELDLQRGAALDHDARAQRGHVGADPVEQKGLAPLQRHGRGVDRVGDVPVAVLVEDVGSPVAVEVDAERGAVGRGLDEGVDPGEVREAQVLAERDDVGGQLRLHGEDLPRRRLVAHPHVLDPARARHRDRAAGHVDPVAAVVVGGGAPGVRGDVGGLEDPPVARVRQHDGLVGGRRVGGVEVVAVFPVVVVDRRLGGPGRHRDDSVHPVVGAGAVEVVEHVAHDRLVAGDVVLRVPRRDLAGRGQRRAKQRQADPDTPRRAAPDAPRQDACLHGLPRLRRPALAGPAPDRVAAWRTRSRASAC